MKVENKLMSCKTCGKEIAKSAEICQSCGAKNKTPILKKWWFWLIIVIFAICVIGAIEGNGDKPETEKKSSSGISSNVVDEPSKPSSNVVNEPSKPSSSESSQSTNVSSEFKSALKKAEVYSKTMNMSKAGIFDQLTSEYGEKFPVEAAQYAIDNLVADYNANALKKAKTYQTTMSMSKSAIYDQLTSEYGEKFTADEAQYAIDNLE